MSRLQPAEWVLHSFVEKGRIGQHKLKASKLTTPADNQHLPIKWIFYRLHTVIKKIENLREYVKVLYVEKETERVNSEVSESIDYKMYAEIMSVHQGIRYFLQG